MYYPYFITYIIVGFVISLAALLWALRNGQFRDQQRARFLPLGDEMESPEVKVSRLNRIETFALLFLVCAGLLTSAAVLIFALFTRG
jgi:cbb3-type cytochrome oxidase maturation protein